MATQLNVSLLKKLRAHFKLTLRDVAQYTGLHINTIYDTEAGTACSINIIDKLAALYHCSPLQLLTTPDQPPKNYALVESMR